VTDAASVLARRPSFLKASAYAGYEPALSIGFVAVAVVLACLVLALPGRSVLTIYTQDVMVYLDGAHRLLSGEVPNRDFHTPLGPLAYVLPAIGLHVSGTLGGAMPAATVAFAVLVAPILAYVCVSRLPLALTFVVSSYLILLAVAPNNPGEPGGLISYAMFYNRFCWVALSLLFLLYIPPKKAVPSRRWNVPDIVCGTALLLVMFYMKVSYAAVGVFFMACLCLYPRTSRFAVSALALSILLIAGIELAVWHSTLAYVADIALAAKASSLVREGISSLFRAAIMNIQALLLFLLIVGICSWKGARRADLLAYAFMVGSGLVILNQNFELIQNYQSFEVITLVPAAAISICMARRRESRAELRGNPYLAAGVLIFVLAAPYMINAGYALVMHARYGLASAKASDEVESLGNIVVREKIVGDLTDADGLRALYRQGSADLQQIGVLRTLRPRQNIYQTEYVRTVRDGMDLLASDPNLAGKVLVLDLSNPFSALLNRDPPRGDSSWFHYQRTFSEQANLPPDTLFADVSVVMEPKDPVDATTSQKLISLYGRYLQSNYVQVAESTYWRALVRTR
jgi:hypothetical protein